MNAMRPDQIIEEMNRQRRKDIHSYIILAITLAAILFIIIAGMAISLLG